MHNIFIEKKIKYFSHIALSIGGFAIGTSEFVVMGILPEIAKSFYIDIATAGYCITSYAVGVVIGAPIIAIFTSQISRKILLIILMSIYALTNIISAILLYDISFLIIIRFFSGLPHGSYFGIASVVASSMVSFKDRPKAIGNIMLGLTIATLIGVPFGTWIGQCLGWQFTFIMISIISILSAIMIWKFVPNIPISFLDNTSSRFHILKNLQIWILLIIISISSGGIFSIFSYIKPILINVSNIPIEFIPFILPLFGFGMVLGNVFGSYFASKFGIMNTIFFTMIWNIIIFCIFHFLVQEKITSLIATFLVGTIFISQPALQARMINISSNSPILAASLMQASFNISNAIGSYIGGLVIVKGFGWTSTAWVGAIFTFNGLILFIFSWMINNKNN